MNARRQDNPNLDASFDMAPIRADSTPLTRQILVELPGIEPGSYGIPSRLLRAQFALPLLGSPGLAN